MSIRRRPRAGSKVIILLESSGHFRERCRIPTPSGPERQAANSAPPAFSDLRACAIVARECAQNPDPDTRIHAEEIVRGGNLVHEQIVHESACLSHQPGIVRLRNGEPRPIIAGNVLQPDRARVLPGLDLAHVAHIQRGPRPCAFAGARRECRNIPRHIPSAEVDSWGPSVDVRRSMRLSKLCRG